MADFDPAIALQGKVPAPPSLSDIVAPITSLAQLQYLQANAQKVQADTAGQGLNNQIIASHIQSLENYKNLRSAGMSPQDAIINSNVSLYDPTGANAMLGNIKSGADISARGNYAADPGNPYSAAAGGPEMVGQAATAAATLSATSGQTEFNKGVADAATFNQPLAPGQTLSQGPAAHAVGQGLPVPPMPGLQPSLSNSGLPAPAAPAAGGLSSAPPPSSANAASAATASQLHGQLGNIMAADPSPQGRAQAAAFARQIPLSPGETPGAREQQIQQFLALPNDQYVLAGQHFQQASMTPEPYLAAAGRTAPAAPAVPSLGNMGVTPAAATANPSLGAGAPTSPAASAPAQPSPSRPAVSPLFANAAQKNGLNASDAATLARTAQIESGNNPNLVNPHSGAAGMMQFVPSTWQKYGSGSPFDPAASADAAAKLLADNKATLTSALGRPPTPTELYLAHQQGAAGAAKLLANPNARAGDLVGNSAIAANGGNPNGPASAFTGMWTAKFGINGAPGTTVTPAGGAAMALPGAPPAVPAAPQAAAINPAALAALAAPATPAGPGVPLANAGSPQSPGAPAIGTPAPAPPTVPQAPSPAPPVAPLAAPLPQNGAPPPTGLAADSTRPLPSGYQQTTQGMSISDKASQDAIGKGWGAQVVEAGTAAQAAKASQLQLTELEHNLSALPTGSGLLTPGPGAAERIGWAKGVNTMLSGAGVADSALPWNPNQIASAEASQKLTGTLGVAMSRALGSREAAQIVHLTGALQPGVSQTVKGQALIAAGVNASLQRQIDLHNFLTANGNKQGADLLFNQQHPISQYAQEAQKLAQIPQQHIDLLEQHADDPRAAGAFDQAYGPGMSRYYVGQ